MRKTLPVPFLLRFMLNFHTTRTQTDMESAATISRALGMFQVCCRQQGGKVSDWMIEAIQEIVRKMTEAERMLFHIPNVRIDDW